MKVSHLRLEIFLTFSEGFGVFEAHFLIKIFLLKKTRVFSNPAIYCYFTEDYEPYILPVFKYYVFVSNIVCV